MSSYVHFKGGIISRMRKIPVAEAVKILNRTPTAVYHQYRAGCGLPFYNVGGVLMLAVADCEVFAMGFKRKRLHPEYFKVEAFKRGALVWCAIRKGSQPQIKEDLKKYPSLRGCRLYFTPVENP